MPATDHAVIVVGSGLAGLATALALAPMPVTLITKTVQLQSGSSCRAKGGFAAAIGDADSPADHAADTVAAGAGISDPELALRMSDEAAAALHWLVDQGIPFDRHPRGELALAREAAHRRPRIVHAGGDATGRVLMSSLIERIRQTPSIAVFENTFACDLTADDTAVQGLVSWNPESGWMHCRSSRIVLATGGIGMAWWHTTNPPESTGDGLAMAARAGAELADLEFMQFHPTALAADNGDSGFSLPLLTEALRGAGAVLVDEAGCRFMADEHAAAELAPRDVVARAIERRRNAGQRIFLDLRPVFANGGETAFPEALRAAERAGLDPRTKPLPVAPAAHFHMGGIRIDKRGRSSLEGLWACGEASATGIHGANRLAGNSLLEAVVYAHRVASDVRQVASSGKGGPLRVPAIPAIPPNGARKQLTSVVSMTRQLMSRHGGVLRCGTELKAAHSELSTLEASLGRLTGESGEPPSNEMIPLWCEARNLLLVARLVTLAAIRREESRGAHFRLDYPTSRTEWRRRQTVSIRRPAELPCWGG